MGLPAAAVAGSVLAPGLVPLTPRVPALDLSAVVADRGPTSQPEAETCCRDHPPDKVVVRAAPLQQDNGQGAPAPKRFLSHVFEGLAARRPQGSRPATEPSRAQKGMSLGFDVAFPLGLVFLLFKQWRSVL
ncbi:unnamed protein product, partial [Prorocentrum cordatum]